MVDRFAIYYSPSSTILKYVQTKNALKAKNLLALGSPPDADIKDLRVAGREVLEKLLYAKTEVQEVGNFFPEKERAVFTDEAATETAAKNYSSSFDLLLFSTHGMLNRADPLKSMIILNKDSVNTDGRLTVSEIENIKFNANLVVLSACETGLISGYGGVSEDIKDAKFPHGDDLVGMQRVFMKSGSASVMSTLWEVDDDSTSTMVIDFFRRYKNGSNKASALREAELMIIEKNPLWEHPYFWAPFVLSGDWR
jgi:CHAT domain-containing protein